MRSMAFEKVRRAYADFRQASSVFEQPAGHSDPVCNVLQFCVLVASR